MRKRKYKDGTIVRIIGPKKFKNITWDPPKQINNLLGELLIIHSFSLEKVSFSEVIKLTMDDGISIEFNSVYLRDFQIKKASKREEFLYYTHGSKALKDEKL